MKEEKLQDLDTEPANDSRSLKEMIEETAVEVPDRLLAYLRQTSGDSELKYAVPPKRIMGGKSLNLLFGFELSSPPKTLAGPLVLRLRADGWQTPAGLRAGVLRELALQDAAGNLGCKVPRIHLKELEGEALGGPFFIMDRITGGGMIRWWNTPILIGLVASLLLWNGWPLLAGYLFGSLVVGLTLGILHRKLHSLDIADIRQIYHQHGLKDADIGFGAVLNSLEGIIVGGNIEEFQPAIKWLKENQPSEINPKLCHGDFHPGNVMGTWTKVSGIIDWDLANIADPECDVAFFRCTATRESGRIGWLILLPLYLFYRVCQGKLDSERLRYYQAVRALHRASGISRYLIENSGDGKGGHSRIIKAILRGMIKRYTRFFRKLTGIELPSPKEMLAKRSLLP